MNVKTILAAKKRNLGGDIVSIEPTADLAVAAKLLSQENSSSWYADLFRPRHPGEWQIVCCLP